MLAWMNRHRVLVANLATHLLFLISSVGADALYSQEVRRVDDPQSMGDRVMLVSFETEPPWFEGGRSLHLLLQNIFSDWVVQPLDSTELLLEFPKRQPDVIVVRKRNRTDEEIFWLERFKGNGTVVIEISDFARLSPMERCERTAKEICSALTTESGIIPCRLRKRSADYIARLKRLEQSRQAKTCPKDRPIRFVSPLQDL